MADKEKKTHMVIAKQLARELQEFFANSYAETTIEEAIKSGNSELLLITVNHFENLRHQILEAEENIGA